MSQVEVHFKLCNDVPFFVCSNVIKEEHKLDFEKEMNHLEKLRIIKRYFIGHSSPVIRKYQNL